MTEPRTTSYMTAADYLLAYLDSNGTPLDRAIREIAEHQKYYQSVLFCHAEGYSPEASIAYRMAMTWTVERLARVYGWTD